MPISGEKKKEYDKIYRKDNKERIRLRNRNWTIQNNRRILKTIVMGYGGKCTLCGEKRVEALILHHRGGGGTAHKIEVGKGSTRFYKWVIINKFPDYLDLLCGTCHLILHRNREELWYTGK